MRNWGGRKALCSAQQYLLLSRSPLCPGTGNLSASGLTWSYSVRPTPLSREYAIQIRFQRGGTPKVFVMAPDISALANGRTIPHVYRDPLHLCLFLPRAKEWDGTMRIDQTFVPWTEVWLFYFEEWLTSDDWKGGGEHVSVAQNRRARRRSA